MPRPYTPSSSNADPGGSSDFATDLPFVANGELWQESNLNAKVLAVMADRIASLRQTNVNAASAAPPVKVMWVGDSITQGFSFGGPVGGFRLPLWQMLRAVRGDVDVIGFLHTYFDIDSTFVTYTGAPPLYALQRWAHSGYSGNQIEGITGFYTSGAVAVSGQPDIIYLMIGTNNVIVGNDAATMQTKYSACLDQIHATSPNAIVVCCRICNFVAGSTASAHLSAWNPVVDAFNAWLADPSIGPTSSRAYCRFLDPTGALSPPEFQSDGVHPNASGFSRIAQAYFDHFNGAFPIKRGRPFPRPFRQRQAQPSIKIATPELDVVTWTNDPTKSPASGDFAVSFDYFPTSLPGALGALFQYGTPYTTGLLIGQTNAGVSVYLAGINVIFGAENQPIVANRWHRVTVIGNRAAGLVGLYVNALPVAIASVVAPWTVATNMNAMLGVTEVVGAAPGYFSNLRFYQGANVPRNESKVCIDALEREYVDGGPLCSGGSSFVLLSEGSGASVADTIPGNPAGVLSSGGGATTGWQVQPHPWDYGF